MVRVEQQNINVIDTLQQSIGPKESENKIFFQERAVAGEAQITKAQTVNMRDTTYAKPEAEEKKTVAEEVEASSVMSAEERKNQMAVLAGTTSEEDYARMQKDGFTPDATTSNTIVTETDKIKAMLAKAGVDISFFGDDLDLEQLTAITGSAQLAAQIVTELKRADLPLSEENIRGVAEALNLAQSLGAPGQSAIRYLIENHLEPSIENFYKAQYSGGKSQWAAAGSVDVSAFSEQVEKVIRQAGFVPGQTTMEDSQWLLEQELPLTEENLKYYEALREYQPSTETEETVKAAVQAIAEGGHPRDALLLPGYDQIYRAEHAVEVIADATDADLSYLLDNGMDLNIRNLEYAIAGRTGAGDAQGAEESGSVAAGAPLAATEGDVGPASTVPGAGGVSASTASGVGGAAVLSAPGVGEGSSASAAPGAGGAAAGGDVGPAAPGADGTAAVVSTAPGTGGTAAGTGAGPEGFAGVDARGLALLVARRQLEEARLVMTAEANYALLRRGVYIDTEPLAALVEKLRASENQYYENLLREQGVEPGRENTAIFRETTEKVEEIRYVPAYVLGIREETDTINAVHKAGLAMRDTFERANERYETLMTEPRPDLGDSIQKAFRNVDAILEEIGLAATEANRRAVRILGYNGLSITQESVAQMKQADEEVQRVFCNMTPAVVTQMIKKGINPLDMDFKSLNAAAEQIQRESGGRDAERFAEYLWKLEKNNAISEDGRNTYIGIYRLIHQVEQTDGAAVGAVLNQGADLTMRNLITAVRSGRHGGMDYAVDDSFGEREESGIRGSSITDQIETAYQSNCLKDIMESLTPEKMRSVFETVPDWENLTPEQLKEALEQAQTEEDSLERAYARECLEEFRASAKASQEIYKVLEKFDIPNTVLNVMAVDSMLKDRNQVYRKLFGAGTKDADDQVGVDDLEQIKQALIEEFGEAVSSPREMAEVQEKLGNLAENVMKTMVETGRVTNLDIREMRLLSAQLSINRMMAKEEQYSVPVLVSDGMVNVSLKIVRGVDKKGTVDIMMESELRGKIAATFAAKREVVDGLIASDNRETRQLLERNDGQLAAALGEEGELTLRFAYISDLDLNHFSEGQHGGAQETGARQEDSEEYRAQTRQLYHIAESFIRMVREVL